jgi:hypothetical protein
VSVQPDKLDEFVNRTEEMDSFSDVLAGRKRIVVLWGPSGMGKTWLLARMMYKCAEQNIRKVEIIFKELSPYDYSGVLLFCRSALHADGVFASYDNLLQRQMPSVNVNLSGSVDMMRGMNATGATFSGPIKAVDIAQLTAYGPTVDRNALRDALTVDFLSCLAAVKEPVVIFIDEAQYMLKETDDWLWQSFIEGLVEKRVNNVWLVIAREDQPRLNRNNREFIHSCELRGLAKIDIAEYLRKKNAVAEEKVEETADLLHKGLGGKPLAVADFVAGLLGAP